MPHYRAEILTILGAYFGRNDDYVNSFWNLLTLRSLVIILLMKYPWVNVYKSWGNLGKYFQFGPIHKNIEPDHWWSSFYIMLKTSGKLKLLRLFLTTSIFEPFYLVKLFVSFTPFNFKVLYILRIMILPNQSDLIRVFFDNETKLKILSEITFMNVLQAKDSWLKAWLA